MLLEDSWRGSLPIPVTMRAYGMHLIWPPRLQEAPGDAEILQVAGFPVPWLPWFSLGQIGRNKSSTQGDHS